VTAAVAPLVGRAEPVSSDEVDELGRGRLTSKVLRALLERPARPPAEPGRPASEAPLALRRIGWSALALQLAAMLAFSTVEYHRFALSVGFGTYAQAWVAIAHGHLDPFGTLIGKAFWRNDAELIVWPLALAYYVYPHTIDLLWVQDVALVATEAVAFGWVLEIVSRAGLQGSRAGRAISLGSLAAVLANPFAYHAVAYDFHSEVLAALFVVLCGRALWSGRSRRLWLWVPLALLTSGLAGLYLVGVGLAGVVAGRRTRRAGAAVMAGGLAWAVAVSLAGGNQYGFAHSLAEWYGYLVGPHHGQVTAFDVAAGVLQHPVDAARMAASRWLPILDFLLAAGLVGVGSAWGGAVAVVVILPSALNANPAFLNPHASFQTWPALPFVLVGSVMVLVRLAAVPCLRRAGVAVAAAWGASLTVLAASLLPNAFTYWLAVSPVAADQLAQVDARVPPSAEVIASWGVVGRFAVRSDVRAYGPLHKTFPVDRRVVVYVLAPGQGRGEVTPATARRAVARVERLPGARVLVARGSIDAIEWRPPPGTTRVTLP